MQFLQPAGAWALLGAAAIVALYMLRRQFVELEVPCTYLWRRALTDFSASRPLQKLKKNILLLIQLALALLLALTLMRPASGGMAGGEAVFIFDLSASMLARGRMAQAQEAACALIDGMKDEAAVTVIAAGVDVESVVTRSADHAFVKRAILALSPSCAGADLPQALSLAQAMARELEGLRAYVFSDSFEAGARADYSVLNAAQGADNRAILSFRLSAREDQTEGVARIANYGPAQEITVEAYADGQLQDIRTISLEAGQIGSVNVVLPAGVEVAQIALAGEDAIAQDDRFWGVLQAAARQKIAYAGAQNVFVEVALSLRDDLDLIRTNEADLLSADASLYVLSGDTLTLSGSGESGITAGEEREATAALAKAAGAQAEALLEHVSLAGVALKAYRPLTGGTPIATCGTDVVVAMDGQSLVFGFDLHDSNLPLKADFPILMQNILSALLPEASAMIEGGECGALLAANLPANVAEASVVYPSGISRALPCVADEVGLYQLAQVLRTGEARLVPFAMHVPARESDVRAVAPSFLAEGEAAAAGGSREWTIPIALGLTLLMMLEWWVSRRGI